MPGMWEGFCLKKGRPCLNWRHFEVLRTIQVRLSYCTRRQAKQLHAIELYKPCRHGSREQAALQTAVMTCSDMLIIASVLRSSVDIVATSLQQLRSNDCYSIVELP